MEKTLKINESVSFELPDGKRIDINIYESNGKPESAIVVTDKDAAGAYVSADQLFIRWGKYAKPRKRKFGVRATDIKLSPMSFALGIDKKTRKAYLVKAFKLNKKQLRALKSKSG